MYRILTFAIVCAGFLMFACAETNSQQRVTQSQNEDNMHATDTAYLGAGCFWCVEAVFDELKGVVSVESGYMGGHIDNPTYEQVCAGNTGHAEIARVQFDSSVISFEEILEVFWNVHDPTTLNRQGNDVGTQYRSVVFYDNEQQQNTATAYKAQLDASGVFADPIVTEISPASTFHIAEDYHQEYFAQNPTNGYCSFVVRPKVEKFRKQFKDRLK